MCEKTRLAYGKGYVQCDCFDCLLRDYELKLFVHSFSKYLLNSYFVPGTVLIFLLPGGSLVNSCVTAKYFGGVGAGSKQRG